MMRARWARAPRRSGAPALGAALLAVALGGGAGAGASAGAGAGEPSGLALAAAGSVDEELERWDLARAAEMVETMRGAFAGDAAFAYAEGRLEFFRGDYPAALDRLEVAARAPGAPRYFEEARALAASAKAATADLVTVPSKDGTVIFRVAERDRVLVPYAEEAFARIVATVNDRLGFRPATPVHVEFLPEVERLSAMTGLSVAAIHTSGTIAICKFARLMVTSPRALLHGYEWIDTLSHEYVHYAVNHLSGATVPIWLHEGLAKYLERAWREGGAAPATPRLPASMEHLLAVALKKGTLIPFEKMHPSMALLPSQEEAALAFAEVFTVVDYIVGRAGWDGTRTLLGEMRSGATVEDAVADVTGVPFKKLLTDWKAGLYHKGFRTHPGHVDRGLSFRDPGAADSDEEKPALGEIKSDKARKFLRLGELLREEGKVVAAAMELEKAHAADDGVGPTIALKLGRASLDVGKPARAVEVVTPLLALYPEMVGVHVVLGRARHALGQEDEAVAELTEALRINPFDPSVHKDLLSAYEALGRDGEAARERDVLALLKR